jgi:hypothetical protein
MEDDLNFKINVRQPPFYNIYGRQPQFKYKGKTASMFWLMEEDLNVFSTGRPPQFITSLS